MADIDIFQNLKRGAGLDKIVPNISKDAIEFLAGGSYRTAKEEFYKKYSQSYEIDSQGRKTYKSMGDHIKTLLNDAPSNEAGRYQRDSKQMQEVKSYLRDFHADFFTFSDKFAKYIDKDTGWQKRTGDLYSLYNTTMYDMYDSGGLSKDEVELIATGNWKAAEALNTEDITKLQIKYNEAKGLKKALDTALLHQGTVEGDPTLTPDTIATMQRKFDTAQQDYYNYSGIWFDENLHNLEEKIRNQENIESNKFEIYKKSQEEELKLKFEQEKIEKEQSRNLTWKDINNDKAFKALMNSIPSPKMSEVFGIKSASGIKAAEVISREWNVLSLEEKSKYKNLEEYLKTKYSQYYK